MLGDAELEELSREFGGLYVAVDARGKSTYR
jgi:hypothetical protein